MRLGHRGARLPQVPENTIAAFELALQAGCDGFELDVRATRDGQLVIAHDARICGLGVAASASAELQQRWQERLLRRLAARRSPALEQLALCCLDDVLRRYSGRAFLDIELKVAGMEEAVLQALREHPPAAFVVSSFLPAVLRELQRKDSRIPLGLICETGRQLAQWPKLALSFLIPHYTLASQKLIADLHGAGKKVVVWTVNREEDMRRLAGWGVDGIVSDAPDTLAQVLG